MSLKPQAIAPVPAETARIARAAYPKGNGYMQMRDVLGSIYTDEDFADLFPRDGQPTEAPWRLALVTVMQFVENRTSQQAADAVRGRPIGSTFLVWNSPMLVSMPRCSLNFALV